MRKRLTKRRNDDLRPEYDLARLKGGVRGKYYKHATAGTNLVLLEPDVARAFPDSRSVNRALRLLQEIALNSGPRAANGRRTIQRMSRETRAVLRARRLAKVSRKVRRESLKVNAEFAAIEGA
jgi:hypothetical protein